MPTKNPALKILPATAELQKRIGSDIQCNINIYLQLIIRKGGIARNLLFARESGFLAVKTAME
jgi:hypothetical protein